MAKDATVVEAKSPEPESPTNTKQGGLLPPSDLSGSEEGGYATEKNPFADPVAAEHWRQVYEKSRYECRHVFDPNLTWTEEEEKRIVRKLDWRICLWAVSRVILPIVPASHRGRGGGVGGREMRWRPLNHG